MTIDSQVLRDRVLKTDEEFRELAAKHQELATRLDQVSRHQHLSEDENDEQVLLKKRKLQLKDRMEDILRRYRS